MAFNPFTYESSKCVLMYLEPNLRFDFSRRVPSIRKTEKVVPLKIEKLSFGLNKVTINNTVYQFGILRKPHFPGAWKKIDEVNAGGGLPNDIDEYGLEDETAQTTILEGDVVMKSVKLPEAGIGHDLNSMEKDLKYYERQLALNLGQKVDEDYDEEELIRYGYLKWQSNEKLDHFIEILRTDLLPYFCKRDNTPAPFDCFIQLSIRSELMKTIEIVNYNKKLYDALKSFCSVLFGNRRSAVKVKHFEIEQNPLKIRLPIGVKFKIQELKTVGHENIVFEALNPIIEESSYPLQVLETLKTFNIRHDSLHRNFRSAKKLIVNVQDRYIALTWLHAIQNLPNKEVHFLYQEVYLTERHLLSLIRNWIVNRREVGTCFHLGIAYSKTIPAFLQLIENEFEGIVKDKKKVFIELHNQ